VQIGQQILSILQSIHELGLVHRDIKPDNFLLKSKQLFMIDFGFCKKYSISDNPKTTTSLIGSPNYASINAHNCVELSRRDDLESLGYMLIYLHLGKLPWSTDIMRSTPFLIQNAHFPEENGAVMNENGPVTLHISNVQRCKMQYEPTVFADYLRYVRALQFNEQPDYNVLGSLIREK
jgi:serine/threonine protein kinase